MNAVSRTTSSHRYQERISANASEPITKNTSPAPGCAFTRSIVWIE